MLWSPRCLDAAVAQLCAEGRDLEDGDARLSPLDRHINFKGATELESVMSGCLPDKGRMDPINLGLNAGLVRRSGRMQLTPAHESERRDDGACPGGPDPPRRRGG